MKTIQQKLLFLVVVWSLAVLVGCASDQQSAMRSGLGHTEYGQASFYADKYQNRRTASGEVYRHEAMTAAHRKLPFGSRVKVTNRNNGKSIIVKINDRGPFVRGRIIDLSKSAFSRIGNTSLGLIDVKVEVIR